MYAMIANMGYMCAIGRYLCHGAIPWGVVCGINPYYRVLCLQSRHNMGCNVFHAGIVGGSMCAMGHIVGHYFGGAKMCTIFKSPNIGINFFCKCCPKKVGKSN